MIPITRPSLPPLEEFVALLEKIWSSKMLSNFGEFSQQLEQAVAEYLDIQHVRSVVSADIGLILTLKALDLPEGAPCYISDFTFNSTINAALWAGLRPVLVDIDEETFNMDPSSLSAASEEVATKGVILPTHVFGNPCDIEALSAIADEKGLFLVFDAAHALGSRRGSAQVGTFGDAEVFSLSGTKLVTSAEGGLIATKHDWLSEKVAYLRAYGFQHDYVSRVLGMNGKISEVHSALGLLNFKNIEQTVHKRLELVATYRARLGESVNWQKISREDRSSYKDISLLLGDRRNDVEDALLACDVQTKRYFRPLHTMDLYSSFCGESSLAHSSAVYASSLCIPAFSDITEEEIELICETVLEALASG